jgi:hypothetical protein
MKKLILPVLLGAAFATVALAAQGQKPARNVSGKKHPNLAAAQMHAKMAFDKITAAQAANEFDMGGHAAKAKELLDQVNAELKLAAEAANAAK